MLTEMAKLQTGSREISGSIDEMMKNTTRINSGAKDVSRLAKGTQSIIEKISGVVNSFDV
jgi:methyl-accepting chemotaxis protein